MFSLTVTYPAVEGARFDMDYYTGSHLALVQEKFGPHGLKQIVLRTGAANKPMGDAKEFASVDLVFESFDAFKAATGAEGKTINADIPNYTDAEAVYSFSEIEIL